MVFTAQATIYTPELTSRLP